MANPVPVGSDVSAGTYCAICGYELEAVAERVYRPACYTPTRASGESPPRRDAPYLNSRRDRFSPMRFLEPGRKRRRTSPGSITYVLWAIAAVVLTLVVAGLVLR